jgi:hypothetical protein
MKKTTTSFAIIYKYGTINISFMLQLVVNGADFHAMLTSGLSQRKPILPNDLSHQLL